MTDPHSTQAFRRADCSGFSLVEVLVAIAILGVTVIFTIRSQTSLARLDTLSEVRTQATTAAKTKLEALRLRDPSSTDPTTGLPNTGYTVEDVWIGGQPASAGRQFRVTTTFCGSPTYCDSVSRHLRIDVSYKNRKVFDVETVVTQLR